ncbi:NEUT protein, partial [Horornis vulcanius]|nr:NEUT protein [Horornis vulcanius]
AAKMRVQLVCVVLLALASCSLCSDSEEEMKAIEADLLTNMYTSKINRAKLPYWKMTLLNTTVQRAVPGIQMLLLASEDLPQHDSSWFQGWQPKPAHKLENSSQEKEIMKRKNPYILKRQLHVNKARRPYILKRSSYY